MSERTTATNRSGSVSRALKPGVGLLVAMWTAHGTDPGTWVSAAACGVARENLRRARKQLKANRGVAGVNGLDVDQVAYRRVMAWP